MRSHFQISLTWTMLATYAGISLLGHGLHWLTPEDEHHYHGLAAVVYTCAAHHAHDGDCCADDHDQRSAVPTVTKSSITDSHDCEICEFLIHAVSQPAQVVTTPDLHALVAEFSCEPQGIYSQALLGLHAARGPPQSRG
jgi:hypothetical protein